jgi:hypothetical protein
MRNTVFFAEAVQQIAPGDTESGLERARGIIDARVNDLAVARARLSPKLRAAFEYECFVAAHGERTRNRKPYHPSANDYCIHGLHRAAV